MVNFTTNSNYSYSLFSKQYNSLLYCFNVFLSIYQLHTVALLFYHRLCAQNRAKVTHFILQSTSLTGTSATLLPQLTGNSERLLVPVL